MIRHSPSILYRTQPKCDETICISSRSNRAHTSKEREINFRISGEVDNVLIEVRKSTQLEESSTLLSFCYTLSSFVLKFCKLTIHYQTRSNDKQTKNYRFLFVCLKIAHTIVSCNKVLRTSYTHYQVPRYLKDIYYLK